MIRRYLARIAYCWIRIKPIRDLDNTVISARSSRWS